MILYIDSSKLTRGKGREIFFYIYSEDAMKNGAKVVNESSELIIGKLYKISGGETFIVESCVGGMSSGIQMKWRIRYMDDGKEKVFVVMDGVLFSVFNKYFFVEYNLGEVENRLEGYAIYSI